MWCSKKCVTERFKLVTSEAWQDWLLECIQFQKNSAVSTLTGVAVALALMVEESSHEQVVQCAITGAVISAAANILSGIF
ncbi:outer envelope pore protein 16-2, chloroplastic-like [Humulus lupulus]|uniref:outer envelope pore protein 16-2, chloroplastic-like n=1 Tax=Humulus lupulus TaxID=3486 RepID=UPI002B40E252|nr:outer envelope pore protein 16-2, chloroplastic-like [Humulus lupulus]